MKRFILIAIAFLSLGSFAQSKSGNDLTAEGNAKVSVAPDIAVLTLEVTKTDKVEQVALKNLNDEIEKVQLVLAKLGFTKKNIKIATYTVSSNTNPENVKEYDVSNSLEVTFTLDNQLINAFYQSMEAEKLADVNIDFETRISIDLEKKTRQLLMRNAVEDAKINAENIAKALNVKLNGVKNVTKYNERLFDNFKKGGAADMKVAAASYANFRNTSFKDYDVQEKELEESITIVFAITKE